GWWGEDGGRVKNRALNGGLGYAQQGGYIPEQAGRGGVSPPPIPIPRIDDVPNWNDINPRLGAAYDLFGNSKTAVKFSFGRYVLLDANTTTNNINPATAVVTSATRTWNDANRNYLPECDLTNTIANGECGALSANGFGTVRPQRTYASDVLNGWHVRQYNWQTSVVLQQEIRPGVGATVGYYRTQYGNFQATQNHAGNPADFRLCCITGPVDPRVPSLNGRQVCGFYDVNPDKFGLVQNVVTQASNFGKLSDVFHGLDFGVNARFGRGGLVNGGVSIGRTVVDACAISENRPDVTAAMTLPTALAPSVAMFNTSTSPSEFCHVVAPWWAVGGQVKFGVS